MEQDKGLLDLADRWEKAKGPDREMDARTWWETYGRHRKADDRASWQRNPAAAATRYWPGWEKRDEIPHLSASLDAAMTLFSDWTGLELLAPVDDAVVWSAYFTLSDGRSVSGYHETRELAVVAALLRALASHQETE